MDQPSYDFSSIRGLVFDLDGTVALHDGASKRYTLVHGAPECFGHLVRQDIPFIIFTNGTVRAPNQQAAALRGLGLPVADGQVVTPSTVAADYFSRQGLRDILLIGGDGSRIPFEEAGLRVLRPADMPARSDAVFVAWAAEFTHTDLDVACNHIWNGTPFFVSTDARFFAGYNGRSLSMSGAVAAGISHVTQQKAEVLGKPSRHAMDYAVARLGTDIRAIGVVGDDPVMEIEMARRCGAAAIGITTGVSDRHRLGRLDADVAPHTIIDSLVEIIRLVPGGK